MQNHWLISDLDGGLYDTRRGMEAEPVRANYARHMRHVETLADVKACLRAGPYAWPGGYECYFVTRDGGILSFEAAREEFDQIAWDFLNNASTGWRVEAMMTAADTDAEVICDHTNRVIQEATE